MRRWRALWRNLWRRRLLDRELEEEVRGFEAMLRDEYIAGGLSPAEAPRAAALAVGGVEQVMEQTRDVRAGILLETLARDLCYGARRLRQRPGYTLSVLLTLGVGIGLATALFGAVDAFILRPLPFPRPRQLVKIARLPNYALAGDMARELKPGLSSIFSDFAAYQTNTVDIADGGEPARMIIAMVSADFFPMFGARLERGHNFLAPDFVRRPVLAPEVPTPVILSDRLWRSRYGARSNMLGALLHWGGLAFQVVGIAPAGFSFPSQSQAWIPFRNQGFATDDVLDHPGISTLIARLRPGLGVAAGEPQLDAWVSQHDPNADPPPYLIPLQQSLLGDQRSLALLLWAASGLVLLLACAGAASLGAAQAWARRRELALRLAIGASFGRLRRQLLAESGCLALASGTVGVLLAAAGTRWFSHLWPPMPSGATFGLSLHMGLFAFGTALLCGTLLGFVPYWRLGRKELGPRLQALDTNLTRPAGASPFGVGELLTAAQLALAVILVAATISLARSGIALGRVPTGLNPQQVLTLEVSLPYDSVRTSVLPEAFAKKYGAHPEMATPAQRRELAKTEAVAARIRNFRSEALARIAALPGVAQAGWIGFPPFAGARFQTAFQPKGQEHAENTAHFVPGDLVTVGPGALPALGVPFLSGRDFRSDDSGGCEVILNLSMVRALGFGPSPRTVPAFGLGTCTVIGIVADVRQAGLRTSAPAAWYERVGNLDASPFLVVRTTPGIAPLSLMPDIRQSLADLAPEAPISHVATLANLVEETHADLHRATTFFGLFAFLAAAIASLSVFAIAVQNALARTREIGVRMVLGANSGDIHRLMLRRQLGLAALALAPAWPLVWLFDRALWRWLFQVPPGDPWSFAFSATGLASLALLAAYFPARRAARISPLAALRHGEP